MIGMLLIVVAWANPELGPADLARVAEGEVVVVLSDDGAQSIAAVDIAAPPARVMEAILDFQHRVESSSMIKQAEVYERHEDRVSVKFKAGLMGFTGTWHTVYKWDSDVGPCTYELDTARENSLEKMAGAYELQPTDGGTRLVVTTVSVPGGVYPAWLIKSAGRSSTLRMLEGLRTRATNPPARPPLSTPSE